MSTLEGAFGKASPDGAPALPALALCTLFGANLSIDMGKFRNSLREYDNELAQADVTEMRIPTGSGVYAARGTWGKHVVDMVGFDAKVPKGLAEKCVGPGHYDQAIKLKAYDHRSHMLLYHGGPEADPFERYVALAAVAGVLSQFGGLVVLNERGHSSLPVNILGPVVVPANRMKFLRNIPIPLLYIGFVKYNLPNKTTVWMRTHGANFFGVPNLAVLAAGHQFGQYLMDMFNLIFGYMIHQKATIRPGDTMQVASDNVRFRLPTLDDPQAETDGRLLVVEKI